MSTLDRLREDVYGHKHLTPDWQFRYADAIINAPPGLMLEFGVASGHSITGIAGMIWPRVIYGFDWFKGLPEDWKPGTGKGAFACIVPESLPVNVRIIEGLFQDTLDGFLARRPERIGFVNMDADIYSSTAFVLSRIEGRFVDGTVLHFDEIHGDQENFDNEGRAFAECLDRTGLGYEVIAKDCHEGAFFRIKKS